MPTLIPREPSQSHNSEPSIQQPVGRVVVVGAGISGIAAARTLHDAGVDCLIVEARDRIGGRLHTVDLAGTPVDLGGSWIHHPIRQSASRTGRSARRGVHRGRSVARPRRLRLRRRSSPQRGRDGHLRAGDVRGLPRGGEAAPSPGQRPTQGPIRRWPQRSRPTWPIWRCRPHGTASSAKRSALGSRASRPTSPNGSHSSGCGTSSRVRRRLLRRCPGRGLRTTGHSPRRRPTDPARLRGQGDRRDRRRRPRRRAPTAGSRSGPTSS